MYKTFKFNHNPYHSNHFICITFKTKLGNAFVKPPILTWFKTHFFFFRQPH